MCKTNLNCYKIEVQFVKHMKHTASNYNILSSFLLILKVHKQIWIMIYSISRPFTMLHIRVFIHHTSIFKLQYYRIKLKLAQGY